jgi:hypothetical protein
MLRTCALSKSMFFYYDLEEKSIARFPTKSNIKPRGSDNSLYFGMVGNEEIEMVFCKLFEVKKIIDISNKNFDMKCGTENVNVCCNLNAEGQIQIKIMKDGTMCRLTSNYSFDQMKDYDFTKMLIVIDFNNKEIRFKDPNDFKL